MDVRRWIAYIAAPNDQMYELLQLLALNDVVYCYIRLLESTWD